MFGNAERDKNIDEVKVFLPSIRFHIPEREILSPCGQMAHNLSIEKKGRKELLSQRCFKLQSCSQKNANRKISLILGCFKEGRLPNRSPVSSLQ